MYWESSHVAVEEEVGGWLVMIIIKCNIYIATRTHCYVTLLNMHRVYDLKLGGCIMYEKKATWLPPTATFLVFVCIGWMAS